MIACKFPVATIAESGSELTGNWFWLKSELKANIERCIEQ